MRTLAGAIVGRARRRRRVDRDRRLPRCRRSRDRPAPHRSACDGLWWRAALVLGAAFVVAFAVDGLAGGRRAGRRVPRGSRRCWSGPRRRATG